MLLKSKLGSRTLYRSKSLLLPERQGYVRPSEGREWFATTTSVWRCDEIIRRRVRDWRRFTGETGHDDSRAETMRKDHDSVYTGTHSVFPVPLCEWIFLRYAGAVGGRVLDAFAGGPPRAMVASLLGYKYTGIEIRQVQIDENEKALKRIGLSARYILADGRFVDDSLGKFDFAVTCPPYFNLEKYSDLSNDLSNMRSYEEFNAGMFFCAQAHFKVMKPGAFVCIVVGPFREKKNGRNNQIIDLPAHTALNFQEAGFLFWQSIVLVKNFASAAKRSANAWRGLKLVPSHEFLQVFRMPE